MDLYLSINPQLFSPSRGQASVCRRSCERSCQPGILVEKTGLRPPGKEAHDDPDSTVVLYCF